MNTEVEFDFLLLITLLILPRVGHLTTNTIVGLIVLTRAPIETISIAWTFLYNWISLSVT